MARQNGILKISGKLDDLSFYKGKDGCLVSVAMRNMLQNAGDRRVTSRLTQVMSKVKNYGVTSARG